METNRQSCLSETPTLFSNFGILVEYLVLTC